MWRKEMEYSTRDFESRFQLKKHVASKKNYVCI